MTDTSITMTEETKATVLSLLQRHFEASLQIDAGLAGIAEFDQDGFDASNIRTASWEQENVLSELKALMGIEEADVINPVVEAECPGFGPLL